MPARTALVQLRARVDSFFEQALARSPTQMQCREGCSSCCGVQLTVFAIEAERICSALEQLERENPSLRERVREQAHQVPHCALLVDHRCVVYAERPLICRSHGLPVLVDDDIRGCELNFSSESPPPSSILALDRINDPLAIMAQMIDSTGSRTPLAELAASSASTPEAATDNS